MKKILILTASIGSGHIKAAEAIEIELRRLLPDAEITTVDFMDSRISRIHWFMKKFYLVMLAFVPNLYDVFYKLSGGSSGGTLVQNAFAYVMMPAMKKLVRRCEPDLVLCTHPFPEGAASLLKRRHKENYHLAAVMTDYSLHQIWLYPAVDRYYMATEEMRMGMIGHGFAVDTLMVPGIPVASVLQEMQDKQGVRRALAIHEGQPAVLLMGGGLGLGGIEANLKDLERIEKRLTLLVVAGRNERLKGRVQEMGAVSHHQVLVWGYTDQVHFLMRAADLLITKPGALTISEAFVLGLPMLLHDPIPGPETENAIYATRHGAAVWLHPREDLARAVKNLLHGDALQKMSKAARTCAKPLAASEIAEDLRKLLEEGEMIS